MEACFINFTGSKPSPINFKVLGRLIWPYFGTNIQTKLYADSIYRLNIELDFFLFQIFFFQQHKTKVAKFINYIKFEYN